MAKSISYKARVVIEKHVRDDGANARGYADNPIVYQITEAVVEAADPNLNKVMGKLTERMVLLDEEDFSNERIERAKGL